MHSAGMSAKIIGTVEGEFVLDIAGEIVIASPEHVKYIAADRAKADLWKSRKVDSDRCGVTCYTEKCEVCGATGQVLHHRTNVRHGYEKRSDYSILCSDHHRMVHRIGVNEKPNEDLFFDPEKMYAHMASRTAEKLNRIWVCPYGFNAAAMPDLGVQVALIYKLAIGINKEYRFSSWDDRLHEYAHENLGRIDDAYFI